MTPTRLLLDEMLTPKIAEQLRARGHEVVAVAERSELLSMPDDELLGVAAEDGRALVTLNIGDFASLHTAWMAAGRAHSGVVLLSAATFPQNRSFIGAVVTALDAAAARGQLPGPNQTRFLRR